MSKKAIINENVIEYLDNGSLITDKIDEKLKADGKPHYKSGIFDYGDWGMVIKN